MDRRDLMAEGRENLRRRLGGARGEGLAGGTARCTGRGVPGTGRGVGQVVSLALFRHELDAALSGRVRGRCAIRISRLGIGRGHLDRCLALRAPAALAGRLIGDPNCRTALRTFHANGHGKPFYPMFEDGAAALAVRFIPLRTCRLPHEFAPLRSPDYNPRPIPPNGIAPASHRIDFALAPSLSIMDLARPSRPHYDGCLPREISSAFWIFTVRVPGMCRRVHRDRRTVASSTVTAAWLLLTFGTSPGRVAAETTLRIEVDARDLPRRLLHTTIRIPCEPGPLALWYPRSIPGTHAPAARSRRSAACGWRPPTAMTIAWRRDPVELYRVTCEVPRGVREVVARLDTICNTAAVAASGHLSYGNASLGIINWPTCLLYPEGADRPRDAGPPGPAAAGEMAVRHGAQVRRRPKDGLISFSPVSLDTLADSPDGR